MIVSREQCPAFDVVDDMIQGGVGDRQAGVERGAPTNFVHDDQRPIGGMAQDGSGPASQPGGLRRGSVYDVTLYSLNHLQHERAPVPKEIVPCPDP